MLEKIIFKCSAEGIGPEMAHRNLLDIPNCIRIDKAITNKDPIEVRHLLESLGFRATGVLLPGHVVTIIQLGYQCNSIW